MATFFSSVQREYGSGSFRATSATQTYAAKVRWMVGGLLSIITLLATALILVFQQVNSGSGEQPTAQPVVNAGAPAKAMILIARQRIEAGVQLSDTLFDVQEVNANYLPEGAIMAAEHSVLNGQYAKDIINAGYPISRGLISATNPSNSEILIPVGYRAIAISIDELKSVAWSIRPNSRVDVVLSHTYKGQPAVTTVVPTAKVVAVGSDGNPNASRNGAKTATILVTAEDAKRVELSKKLGEVSLILAGEAEIPKVALDSTSPIGPGSIFSPEQTAKAEANIAGRMVVVDKHTGMPTTYVLKDGRWTVEK